MSVTKDPLLCGIRTGTSATDTSGSAQLHKWFTFTGVANQVETFTLPADAQNLSARVLITTPGAATANNNYIVQQNGQAVIQFTALGSAAGNFTTYTTATAAWLAVPAGGSPFGTGASDGLTYSFIGSANDTAVRGRLVLSYNRTQAPYAGT